jgi:hypothetical protein
VVGASVGLHLALVVLIGAGARSFVDRGEVQRVLLLPAPQGGVREEAMPAFAGIRSAPRASRPAGGPTGAAVETVAPVAGAAPSPSDSAPALAEAPTDPRDVRGERRLPPALASGQLWVRPLPAAPQELAQRLQRTHEELADSAVTATVQAYLDSVAREPGAGDVALPDWTTEVGGRKFGLDDKYIYVAGIRIPAVLLALLPLPAAGNYDRNQAYNRLMDIRRDIYQAAARADNTAEFKRYVKEIRERKERERQFREAQRQAPDSAPAAPQP